MKANCSAEQSCLESNMDGRSRKKVIVPVKHCEECGTEMVRKTKSDEKRINLSQYLRSRYCSRSCKGVAWSKSILGKNNPNWMGGSSSRDEIIRGSNRYKKWRLGVFVRDNWTCTRCGVRGGELNAHHVEPFSKNKKLRFETSNGVTFCDKCHKDFHKEYGFNNDIKQLSNYLK